MNRTNFILCDKMFQKFHFNAFVGLALATLIRFWLGELPVYRRFKIESLIV